MREWFVIIPGFGEATVEGLNRWDAICRAMEVLNIKAKKTLVGTIAQCRVVQRSSNNGGRPYSRDSIDTLVEVMKRNLAEKPKPGTPKPEVVKGMPPLTLED